MQHLDGLVDSIGKTAIVMQQYLQQGNLSRDQAIDMVSQYFILEGYLEAARNLTYAYRTVEKWLGRSMIGAVLRKG